MHQKLFSLLLLFCLALNSQAAPATLRIELEKEARIQLDFSTFTGEKAMPTLMFKLNEDFEGKSISWEKLEGIPNGLIKELDIERPVLSTLHIGDFSYPFWIRPNEELNLFFAYDEKEGWKVQRVALTTAADQALAALYQRFPALFASMKPGQKVNFSTLQAQMAAQIQWYEEEMAEQLSPIEQRIVENHFYWHALPLLQRISDIRSSAADEQLQWPEWQIFLDFVFSEKRVQLLENGRTNHAGFYLYMLMRDLPADNPEVLQYLEKLPVNEEIEALVINGYLCHACRAAGNAASANLSDYIEVFYEHASPELREELERWCY